MKLRVAIFGATGQLGTDLVDILGQDDRFEICPLSHKDAECTDLQAVRQALARSYFDAVVNCAAVVHVDECEDRPDEAFRVNAVGAYHIAKACAEIDARCVYISTDYVFDGVKRTAYVESDVPNPINVYGASKLAGEYLTRQAAPRWLIVRVASLFGKTGARGKGGNFIETILAKAKKGEELRVVNDIRISPTYTRDAANLIKELLAHSISGIVHAANRGSCTWYEFAKAALNACEFKSPIEAVSSGVFLTRAMRPKNSALQTERQIIQMARIPEWESALNAYLDETGHRL